MKPGKMAGKVLPLFSAALCFLPLFSSLLKAEEAIVTGIDILPAVNDRDSYCG